MKFAIKLHKSILKTDKLEDFSNYLKLFPNKLRLEPEVQNFGSQPRKIESLISEDIVKDPLKIENTIKLYKDMLKNL